MPCYAGLDLGQSDDFSAFVLIWDLEDGRVAVRSRFWIPESALDRHPDRSYDAWGAMGALEVTAGNTTDYDQVEEAVAADCLEWGVREFAYDKRFAEQMSQHLQGHGITMVNTPQGFGLNEGCRKLLERLLSDTNRLAPSILLLIAFNRNIVSHGTGHGDCRGPGMS